MTLTADYKRFDFFLNKAEVTSNCFSPLAGECNKRRNVVAIKWQLINIQQGERRKQKKIFFDG